MTDLNDVIREYADDLAELQHKIEILQEKNARLRAELAKADKDNSEYTELMKGFSRHDEIARLRSIIRRAVPVINQSRSAYIQGTQSDSEWHMQVEQWLADVRTAITPRYNL